MWNHGVFDDNKPSQLRTFFVASAKYEDIKQMYHQAKVSLIETDAMQFLWRNNPSDHLAEHAILAHVFKKVDFPCCCIWTLRQICKKTAQVCKILLIITYIWMTY